MKYFLITLLFALSASAQITVTLKSGTTADGSQLSEKTGRIVLTLEDGSSRSFKKDEIKSINSPMPKYVFNLIKYTNAGKYDAVLKTEPKFKEIVNFGWGHLAHVYYCRAMIAKGDIDKARRMLRLARFTNVHSPNKLLDDTLILSALIDLEVLAKDLKKADEYIQAIKEFDTGGQKFYFLALGNYYRAKGDPNRAVQEYYKVVLLENKTDHERITALSKIEEIYKEFNDPRLADLDKL